VAAGTPTDPAFYQATQSLAQALGSKPEDLLWVWASETGYDPTLSGESRTISTLMHTGVVPSLLTEAEWQSLPTLTPAQQIPFIQRYYQKLVSSYLGGRAFQDTFEAYLGNAAPGLLRVDGKYNPKTVMYGDPNQPGSDVWAQNWPMDNYPVASQQAQARGAAISLDFGRQLLSEGLLKGWLTLGDLKAFMLRPSVGVFANPAIQNLHSVQAGAGVANASYNPSSSSSTTGAAWTPNGDQSFSDPNAPIDTRVAPAAPTPRPLFALSEIALVAGAAWLGIWLGKR